MDLALECRVAALEQAMKQLREENSTLHCVVQPGLACLGCQPERGAKRALVPPLDQQPWQQWALHAGGRSERQARQEGTEVAPAHSTPSAPCWPTSTAAHSPSCPTKPAGDQAAPKALQKAPLHSQLNSLPLLALVTGGLSAFRSAGATPVCSLLVHLGWWGA